jgi:hypothetical protein
VDRQYAGILGMIAFTTVILQGLVHDVALNRTLEAAAISTVIFCVIGGVVGRLAGWIVLDSMGADAARESADGRLKLRPARSTKE